MYYISSGLCHDEAPFYIVMEFMNSGALLGYLKEGPLLPIKVFFSFFPDFFKYQGILTRELPSWVWYFSTAIFFFQFFKKHFLKNNWKFYFHLVFLNFLNFISEKR